MSDRWSRGCEPEIPQIASFSFWKHAVAIGAFFRWCMNPGAEAALQGLGGTGCRSPVPQQNSASRWRFRPLLRLTFRLPPTRPPVEPRPNLAPCSLQGGSYGLERRASSAGKRCCSQIAAFSLHNGLFAHRVGRSSGRFGGAAGPVERERRAAANRKSMLRSREPQETRSQELHAKSGKRERDGGIGGPARRRHGRRPRDRQGDRGAPRGRGRVALAARAEPGRARAGGGSGRGRCAPLRHP